MEINYSYDTVPYPSYAYPQTHPDLLEILVELTANGTLTLTKDDKPVDNVDLAKQFLANKLDAHLQLLAQTALLVG